MELSNKDMQRLEQAGHSKEEFAKRGVDGIWRLRNVEGHCVFLESKGRKCLVYSLRPLGCYIYPVNLGPDGALTVDVLCPASDSLEADEKKKKGVLLRRHLREIDSLAKQK
jgi:Fe-S-cluster containining protein